MIDDVRGLPPMPDPLQAGRRAAAQAEPTPHVDSDLSLDLSAKPWPWPVGPWNPPKGWPK